MLFSRTLMIIAGSFERGSWGGAKRYKKLLSLLDTMQDLHKHTCTAVDSPNDWEGSKPPSRNKWIMARHSPVSRMVSTLVWRNWGIFDIRLKPEASTLHWFSCVWIATHDACQKSTFSQHRLISGDPEDLTTEQTERSSTSVRRTQISRKDFCRAIW